MEEEHILIEEPSDSFQIRVRYEIIGNIAGICTTSAFVPQLYDVVVKKNVQGLSVPMYVIFTLGVALWIFYGFLKQAKSLIIFNSVTLLLAVFILVNIVVK